jgi:di/tricarboxylate transporter
MPSFYEAAFGFFAWQPVQMALAVTILAGALYGFISEKLPPDVTALLALLALLVTGVLTPLEAFSGFSHPATVSVAAVLVLSAGLQRTGALSFVARRVLAPLGSSEILLTVVMMAVIGGISAFINNTAAVAVFIPVVLEVCRRTGHSPGRLLMPMAHAATFGGMCTLIGTSTNLVAHEFARHAGLPGFTMFELGKVGLPMMLAGFAYILVVGRWFLPRGAVDPVALPGRPGQYAAELVVTGESRWVGGEFDERRIERDHEVDVVDLVRGETSITRMSPAPRLLPGDRLRVRGTLEHVLALATRARLAHHRPDAATAAVTQNAGDAAAGSGVAALASPAPPDHGAFASGAGQGSAGTPQTQAADRAAAAPAAAETGAADQPRLPLAEVVVLPGSPLLGRTLKEARFAERFDTTVLALHRPNQPLFDHPAQTPLHAGDVMLVEGTHAAIGALAGTHGFLLVGEAAPSEERPDKLGIALLTILGVVFTISLGILPVVTAATAGCAVLMVTGCLKPREAYQAIDWSIVFLLAGALALGLALEKTGLTALLAGSLAHMSGASGPFVVMAGFLLLSMLVSEFMSNSGTVALLAPIALSTAAQLGVNPMALLVAITFGASAAFAMPIGYQTSLMIYGPGGYRFKDFIRMGIPLDLLLAALALWLIPQIWPLTLR